MMWMLRQILVKWVETFILAGDARIPLFWTLSDKSRLSLWHRTSSALVLVKNEKSPNIIFLMGGCH